MYMYMSVTIPPKIKHLGINLIKYVKACVNIMKTIKCL